MGASRMVQGPDGEYYYYGWLLLPPVGDDAPSRRTHNMVVPPPRRVRFMDDGQIHLMWHEGLERFTSRVALSSAPPMESPVFTKQDQGIVGKNFSDASTILYPDSFDNVIFSAKIRFVRGERAGLILRSTDDGKTGWQFVVDRRLRRIEFGLLGHKEFIDARAWSPTDEVTLKVVANHESVEVYLDDRLLIHQVRHREIVGRIGLIVDRAEAGFTDLQLRVFNS